MLFIPNPHHMVLFLVLFFQRALNTNSLTYLLSETKIEKLQDFLTKMFENFSEVKLENPQSVKVAEMTELFRDYCNIMQKAYDTGDIQKALAAR